MPTALPTPQGSYGNRPTGESAQGDQGLRMGPGRLCGSVGSSSAVPGGVERSGAGNAQLGRKPEHTGGGGGLCGWESSLWTLHPVLLLSLVKRGLNGSPPPAASLLGTLRPRQGRSQATVPRRGGAASTDGHREADTQPGERRDADGRAASLSGGPWWRLDSRPQGWMVWWAVGAEGQVQALFALLTQMSCSRGCLTQIGKLSPILVTPVSWLGCG